MTNKIELTFSSNPIKSYYCVSGSVFNDEYNETLDSAVVILDDITSENRLNDLSPYEYVKVANKGVSALFDNRFYLIDNYVEKETNIHKHIYQYTINLMSETKLLEKIQCPNLVITHSEIYGTLKISDHIDRYMKLYCPKVKIYKKDGTWHYDYIIKWDVEKLEEKFFVDCADMSLSLPTLRQLLTSLMLQVGCIPVVKNRELTWIDFNEKQTTFNRLNSMNYFQKSLSSDSYVNTLVNNHNQVLDTDNIVISETAGFRNRDNAILQQLGNLTIETKFPIYDIKKFVFKLEKPTNVLFKPINTTDYYITGFAGKSYLPDITNIKFSIKNNRTLIIDKMYYYVSNQTGDNTSTESRHPTKISNLEINVCIKNTMKVYNQETYQFKHIGKKTFLKNGAILNAPNYSYNGNAHYVINATTGQISAGETLGSHYAKGYWYSLENLEIPVNEDITDISKIAVWIKNDIKDLTNNVEDIQFVPFVEKIGEYYPYVDNNKNPKRIYTYYNVDITPLVVENSKRNLKSANYVEMGNATTLEELAEYVYGTIGYSIGTKQISGFSQTYSIANAWWQKTYSVIENIINFIMENDLYNESNFDYNILYESVGGLTPELYTANIYEIKFPLDNFNFATLMFDIEYQPLNSYNLKYVKEVNDVPLLLEQLDSSENGVVDFDRTSLNEQDKINRLGNDILSINQVTNDEREIQPLNSQYGNYTIFKRSVALDNNFFSVNYYASKNYVMQNYFTSITTKYRAYEKVDYNQSVIRKENQTIFVYIGEKIISANDDIHIKNLDKKLLVSGLENYIENPYKINYSYEKDGVKSYKNDVSVITAKNLIAFVYENYDNASAGQYLVSNEVDTNLQGIAQQNYMYSDDYYISHEVGFINKFSIMNKDDVAKLPLIKEDYQVIFNLVDNNKNSDLKRTFYKDNAEIINQTVQFIYYTDSDKVIWTNLFLENNKMVGRSNYKPNVVIDISGQEFKITDEIYNYLGDIICKVDELLSSGALMIGANEIVINWEHELLLGKTQIKISSSVVRPRAILKATRDFIAFKKGNETVQYLYYGLQDSKTFRKYKENNGLIYLE